MRVVTGDLWDEVGRADLILFTANNVVTSHGELVMGKGAALEAKQRFPNLPKSLGPVILRSSRRGFYGIAFPSVSMRTLSGTYLAAFQTKCHWREVSSLDLIRRSALMLCAYAPSFERIAMNYPGVGAGGRTEEEVLPLIECLPSNCYVYKK